MTRASYEVVALLKEKAGTNEFTPLPAAALERFMSFPDPESIAPLIVYLASDAAANVSGSVFHIKGGNIGFTQSRRLRRPSIKKMAGGQSMNL